MEQHGPTTRSRARDSLELIQRKKNLYPKLIDAEDEGELEGDEDVQVLESEQQPAAGYLRDLSGDSEESLDSQLPNSLLYNRVDTRNDSVNDDQTSEYDAEERTPFMTFKIIVFLTLLLPIVIAVVILKTKLVNAIFPVDADTMLDNQFQKSSFILPNKQLEIKQNILDKIVRLADSDPLSIYILYREDQKDNVTEFAQGIAYTFAKYSGVGSHESFSAESLQALENADQTLNHKIDSHLSSVIIQDFTNLHWDQAKLFLKYCDNENAPYKGRMFVFTSVVRDCDPEKPDKGVEEALLKASWGVEQETVEALAVRISGISVCVM